jgi:cobalt-zinc-cadmium efflux system outer membrane protein
MKGAIFCNNRISKYGMLAIVFLLSVPVYAQKYTLNDVLNKIEQNNPSILAYQNRIDAAIENAKSARAWAPPKAGVEWDMLPYNLDYDRGSMLRLSAMQDFPNAKRNSAKESYMKSIAFSEKYAGEFHKVELFAEAKEVYYKIYISQRRIAVLRESGDALKLMIDLGTKQMAITKGDLAPIYRIKARLTENETMIIHEQNMVRAFQATLNFLMNEDANQTLEIDTSGLLRNYRGLSTFLKIDSLDCRRSDLMKMNSEINTAKLNQNFVSLRGKPEFGMKLEHYQRFGSTPNAFAIMGTMTIPSAPWSARSYKSEVRALDYRISAMEQDKKNMVNMAMQMIKMYLIELESENRELDNYADKVIPSYKKSLDASILAYGQNTNDMNMTLMAWDDLLMSQTEYLKHLDNYFRIQTEYEKELQIR